MMKKFSKILGTLFFSTLFLISCSNDNDDAISGEEQNAKIYITDAPIDNAEVSGAFVTITNVKVDGKSVQGFEKVTINLLALQNGNTKALGNVDLKAKTYSKITLILDYDADANGNFPGTYVETKEGVKHAIEATSNEINVNHAFDVLASAENDIIIDFDLRKTITSSTDATSRFAFVTMVEMEKGIRVVNKARASAVSGTATDANNTSDKIVVYAYKKGTFNAETETKGQGQSQIKFANAVSSAVVNKVTGSYSLNFLEEGDYELHFASYNENETSGELEFTSMLSVESLTNISVANIKVSASINVNVNVKVTGRL